MLLYLLGSCLHTGWSACCCASQTQREAVEEEERERKLALFAGKTSRINQHHHLNPHHPPKWHPRSLQLVHTVREERRLIRTSLHCLVKDGRVRLKRLSSLITCWWYPSIQLCDLEAACAPPAFLAHSVPHCKKCPSSICSSVLMPSLKMK